MFIPVVPEGVIVISENSSEMHPVGRERLETSKVPFSSVALKKDYWINTILPEKIKQRKLLVTTFSLFLEFCKF